MEKALVKKQEAESLVLIGMNDQPLRHRLVADMPVRVYRRAYEGQVEAQTYVEGEDYMINNQGRIARTPHSAIPDGSQHSLYGVDSFDHTEYPDYEIGKYMVCIDYSYEDQQASDDQQRVQTGELTQWLESWEKTHSDNLPLKYVAFGDSITVGGDVSNVHYSYVGRFGDHLQQLLGDREVLVINRGIGGDTSTGGVSRLQQDVLDEQPDVVTIAFGMNDQNDGGQGPTTTVEAFVANLETMITQIQAQTTARVILVTPCEPNPCWKYASGRMGDYAEAIRQTAARHQLLCADAHQLWQQELQAGKSHQDLLWNNVNHPNDYGHAVYHQAFVSFM